MVLERVNLHTELKRIQEKSGTGDVLLKEVQNILNQQSEQPGVVPRIRKNIQAGHETENLLFNLLDTERIFHISQIKKLCATYRLRFLGTEYFRGSLPLEAINAVEVLEAEHQTIVKEFKIIAPASYFRLENADDPMLFAALGNGHYYLIHQWGRDMHPLRKILMWPLKNLENLIISCLLFGFILTFGIREIFFSPYQSTSQFLILFLYTFKSVIALVFFYGISLGKNFSAGNWNSRFYNA